MAYPTLPEFQGIPPEYQGGATWVSDPNYAGGGYFAGYGMGQHYTYAQLERLWIDAGGSQQDAPQAAAKAEAESGGYAGAWNSSGATSLWQIEWPMNYSGPREDLFTPLTNAQVAVKMQRQSGWSPWAGDNSQPPQNVPPANVVPNETQQVAGSSPGGGVNAPGGVTTTSAATSALSPLATFFGFPTGFDPVDALERLGLILLGASMILIGIWMLAGKQALQVVGLGGKVSRIQRARRGEGREERRLNIRERRVALAEETERRKAGRVGTP